MLNPVALDLDCIFVVLGLERISVVLGLERISVVLGLDPWTHLRHNQTMKQPCVYIMASKPKGTLYIGVTSDLIKRIWEHKQGSVDGFTKQYQLKTLVWFEQHISMEVAIQREKTLKKWLRAWKIQLIEESNPEWKDLYPSITE